METSQNQDEFISAGLDAFGIETDEVDLAVIGGAKALFWPPILELVALDTSEIAPEPNPNLSQAPPR
ncbi:MAG: hypothetical protein ACJ75T_00320 [Solirubrobacterales bacterium]